MDSLGQAKSLKKLSKQLNVLYVEDDSSIRVNTHELFKQIFNKVDIAVDGVEGIESYKKYFLDNNCYYDIVITDILMPNMNGIDMSKAIHEINKNQKIVVISAHNEKEYLIDAINTNIDGFIQKPLELEQFIEVIRKISMTFHFDDLQYFNALTEASIVSKTDIDGVITYVNDNFCKITGYSREEMLGNTHRMFRHPSNKNIFYEEMWNTISSGKIWRDRIINLDKNGSDFISETAIIPLIGENGVVKEYMAIRNNVTDIVNFKRKILQKEQEKQQQDKIAEAQKSFLVVFTHELKTPLNAIINFSKYIKKQMESSKELKREKLISLLDSILNNSKDMLENVTQILEISKLNAHKLTYSYSLFNVKDSIYEVLNRYDSLIVEKKIKVIINTTGDVFIKNDMFRVKQIFSNIISNAIKYGDNEIIITIMDNENVTISIEDNGQGIKDKVAVFNLYSQEDDELLERKSKGTGIGLYFIKLLCKDLDIKYKVEDRDVERGTKFSLIFENKINNEKRHEKL